MVSELVTWIKDRLGISALERENLQLLKAATSQRTQIELMLEAREDHEARIAFLENSLTAKPTTAKIVPKSANWKQFRTAAEKATEEQQEPA